MCTVPRRFIRHPADVPLSFTTAGQSSMVDQLRDVGVGGLSFLVGEPVLAGSEISLEIGVQSPPFKVSGTVVWCQPEDAGYAIGVAFADPETQYTVRMVEQVCHIEQYRADVAAREGRKLSAEQAANEWVEKYAAVFPPVG